MTKKQKLLSMFVVAFLITGCTSSDKTSEKETASNEPASTTSPTEISNRSMDVSTDIQVPNRINGTLALSLGFSTSLTDPRGIASELFKKEVEEQTNGTVTIALYPDSQKGSDEELISSITTGRIDMTVSSAGNFTGYVNEVGISALPFLFQDFENAWEFMDSTVVADINKNLEEFNIHVLAHFDNGFRCVTTKDKPINTPNDLVGLNIRTPDNAVVKETMSALGALPQTLGFSELYSKLEDGTFDAQENPIPIIYNNKFYQVQHYLAVTNHSYDAMPFVISQAAWDALTSEEQAIIQEAAINAQTSNRKLIQQQTEEYISKLEAEGMHITYPNLDTFKEKTESVKTFFNYNEKLLESVNAIIQ